MYLDTKYFDLYMEVPFYLNFPKKNLKYSDVLSVVFTVVSDLAIQSFEDLVLVLWKYHAWFQY